MAELFKQSLFCAVQSRSFERFKATILEHHQQKYFDEVSSEFYEEINLRRTQLSSEFKDLLEKYLIKTRLFEEHENRKHDSAKERKDFLVFLIDELNKHNKEGSDGAFVFISRCIASNIHTLKKQIKYSYCEIPWEEMEFCLAIFVANRINRDLTLISHLLLDRKEIICYLNVFRHALDNLEICESKLKLSNRVTIKKNVLSKHLQFTKLYEDYEILRDVYSLKRMQWYMNVVFTPKEGEMKQHAIERTLQVIGENLKNTPESPNISPETEKRLLDSAPKQLKKVLTSLRNMLSHVAVLEQKIFLEDSYRERIENDLLKVYVEVNIILLEKLKKVSDKNGQADNLVDNENIFNFPCTKEMGKIGEIIAKLKVKHPEDKNVYDEFFDLSNRKLAKMQSLWKELRFGVGDLEVDDVDENETLRKFIEACMAVEKLDGNPREQLQMTVVALEASLFDQKRIKSISDYKEELEKNVEKKVDRICAGISKVLKSDKEKERFDKKLKALKRLHSAKVKVLTIDEINSHDEYQTNIKVFPSKIAKTLEELSPAKHAEEIKKTVKSVSDAYDQLKQNVAADNGISSKSYRNLLSKFCKVLDLKNVDNIVNHLVGSFEQEVKTYFDNRLAQLIKIMDAKEINNELRMISTEMLLLDLLEILINTYNFTNNTSFLDRSAPLLTGKNLRNYLAHGNPLIDTFPFDPRNSTEIHCKFFKENLLIFDEAVNYGQTTIFTLENAGKVYHRRLAIVENQTAMFEAARQGNMRKVVECVGNGADPAGFDVNGESGLKCAVKANSVELLMYFWDQSVEENVESLLESATENGCLSIVEYLLETNQEARECLQGDNKLLHLAVLNDKRSMVRFLLNSGCKANAVVSGRTPLHLAALEGFDVVADILLNHDASVSLNDNFGEQPLHVAASSGSWKCAELFLKRGADVNARNHVGCNALHIAAEYGHVEFIEKFLENNVTSIDVQNKEGLSALFLAALNGHEKTVEILLKHNAQPQIKTVRLETPLHAAANFGCRGTVELLLKNGASPLAKDFHSWAPLHFAAFKGRTDLIKPLFHPGLKTETSATALHLAAYSGNKKTVEAVLDCENEVIDSVDEYGCTALYMAAFRGNVDAVKVLLAAGATTNTLTKQRKTAFLAATAEGHQEIVDLLLAKVKEELNCALHVAVEFNRLELVKELLKAGADPKFEVQTICKALEGHLALQTTQNSMYVNYLPVETRNCLMTAVQKGNIDIVQVLLETAVDIDAPATYELKWLATKEINYTFGNFINTQELRLNIVPIDEKHCLHFAAIQGHTEIIELLLKAKYRVNKDIKDTNGATALCHAACHDHKNAVQALLSAGANANMADLTGQTPLHKAAFRGFVGTVELLLRHGADIHAKSNDDTTVLEMAVLSEQTAILEKLLTCDFTFDERYMAFQTGIIQEKSKTVEVFLQKENAKRFSVSLFSLYPPLHNAVFFGRENVLEMLLKHGFEVNATFSALTPLHLAVIEGKQDSLIELLLRHGADVNMADANGFTPLILAVWKNDVKTAQLLLKYVADVTKPRTDVNLQDKQGMTCLHWAVKVENIELVQLLVENEADLHLKNNEEKTAVEVALENYNNDNDNESLQRICGYLMSLA